MLNIYVFEAVINFLSWNFELLAEYFELLAEYFERSQPTLQGARLLRSSRKSMLQLQRTPRDRISPRRPEKLGMLSMVRF